MDGLNGQEKAAILFRSLNSRYAEQVLARLDPAHGERLRRQVKFLEQTPALQKLTVQVMREFDDVLRNANRPTAPPASMQMQPKAMAPASPMSTPPRAPISRPDSVSEPVPDSAEDPVAALARLDPDGLALALQGENPRTAALILNCLEPQRAGEVLKRLAPDLRKAVSLQLSGTHRGGQEMIRRLASAILLKSRLQASDTSPRGDSRYRKIAEMLRVLEREDRRDILAALQEQDPDTSTRVKDLLYQFEDLLLVEDRSMQKLLAEIDSKTLATALKGVEETILEKVSNNLSKRARESLTEEMEFLGSIPQSQITQAQKVLVDIMQQLDQAGELVIRQG